MPFEVRNVSALNEYFNYIPHSKYEMEYDVHKACKQLVEEKTGKAILLSGLKIVLIPIFFILIRIIYRFIANSYKWVIENETIK